VIASAAGSGRRNARPKMNIGRATAARASSASVSQALSTDACQRRRIARPMHVTGRSSGRIVTISGSFYQTPSASLSAALAPDPSGARMAGDAGRDLPAAASPPPPRGSRRIPRRRAHLESAFFDAPRPARVVRLPPGAPRRPRRRLRPQAAHRPPLRARRRRRADDHPPHRRDRPACDSPALGPLERRPGASPSSSAARASAARDVAPPCAPAKWSTCMTSPRCPFDPSDHVVFKTSIDEVHRLFRLPIFSE
jgi:hypothetical protein